MAISPSFKLRTDDAANLLDGLVSVNLAQISRSGLPKGKFPVIEAIQSDRIRYKRADPNEHWQTWNELVGPAYGGRVGRGDCEDLSAAVVAELAYNGIPARTYVYKSGGKLYHVVVKADKWATKTNPLGLLDPSRAAGMGGNG
jgi:hypothetical protein